MRFHREEGFTLIEITFVIAVIAILSTVGTQGFIQYTRIQKLQNVERDVVGMLTTAKSRAQSQVKPTSGICASATLTGYQVTINQSNATYTLDVVCGGTASSPSLDVRSLTPGVGFNNQPLQPFLFQILRGGVNGASDTGTPINLISLEDNSLTKSITVYSSGRISSN